MYHEGDEFGRLALVKKKPRAATIITNENDSQLLSIDKQDYERILKVSIFKFILNKFNKIDE